MENWDNYRYFLAVVRTGSYSAAARALRVSQPTVARHIQQLESCLDVRLLDQIVGGARPTPTGQAIAKKIADIEGIAEGLKHESLEYESELSGTVSVTATCTLSTYWLTEKIESFSSEFPEIRVQCFSRDTRLNIEDREADIALRFGRPESSDIIGFKIGAIQTGLYGSRAYLEKFGIPRSLDDLDNHKIIDTSEPISNFQQLQKVATLADWLPCSATTNCSHTYINMGLAGLGLICVPCYAAESDDRFHRVLENEISQHIELWLLANSRLHRSASVRAFFDFIKREAKADKKQLHLSN